MSGNLSDMRTSSKFCLDLVKHQCYNIIITFRDINIVIKEFNNYVLQAAKECIPKGARKDYKPYWNEDLNNRHDELTTARNLADVAPSIENNTALKQANAKFIKTRKPEEVAG